METKTDSFWQKNQLMMKAGFIAILTLLLLIPMAFISNLVRERQSREQNVYKEISGKWASPQTLTGPMLIVPYHRHFEGKDGPVTQTRYAYFLPDSLNVSGEVLPEKKRRGIYEVIVYHSNLHLAGNFRQLEDPGLKIASTDWMPGEAVLMLGISDLRGIEQQLAINWQGKQKFFNPGLPANDVMEQGVSVPVAIDADTFAGGEIPFSVDLALKGSGSLSFVPAGKSTTVHLSSPWTAPSFTGSFLPASSHVDAKGFTGDWTIFNLNRNFPQRWTDGGTYHLKEAAFGVSLMQPVDFYQKTMRCIKYAILIIALTFTVFFMVETGSRSPVHPLQYLLIGLALCIFYTLLISISEYLYFTWAYGIAAAATTALITVYSRWVSRDRKMPVIAACSLALLYGYIFVLVQLEDFALLVGSIGLFIILAVLMYFSRHINRESAQNDMPA